MVHYETELMLAQTVCFFFLSIYIIIRVTVLPPVWERAANSAANYALGSD